MKHCPTCKQDKPEADFYACKRTPSGLKAQCKRCHLDGAVRTRDPDRARVSRREDARRARLLRPEKVRAREREQARRRRPDVKTAARGALNAAVRAGKIQRPAACSRCKATVRIVGHHPDYSKPLDVEWLCDQCHADEHRVRP